MLCLMSLAIRQCIFPKTVTITFSGLSRHAFLLTGDAVHLLSAKVSGITEIYSNDKHLLASAPYVGMTGHNVIDVNEAS